MFGKFVSISRIYAGFVGVLIYDFTPILVSGFAEAILLIFA